MEKTLFPHFVISFECLQFSLRCAFHNLNYRRYSKTCKKWPLKKKKNGLKTNYGLMQVKSVAALGAFCNIFNLH